MQKAARWAVGVLILSLFALGGCFLFPNRPPVAEFTVLYNVVEGEPLVVDLDASASADPDDDEIVAYMWTFGDDVDILTPLETTKLVTVRVLRVHYPTAGTYSVQLRVRDARGADSTSVVQTIALPHVPAG